uniref:Uncharacterized protein n=1 Tax=Anguilla anguilla TaxID=7936 RepID=A0A0E9S0S8_ANGAN
MCFLYPHMVHGARTHIHRHTRTHACFPSVRSVECCISNVCAEFSMKESAVVVWSVAVYLHYGLNLRGRGLFVPCNPV